jgi:hypothetical protein
MPLTSFAPELIFFFQNEKIIKIINKIILNLIIS